MIEFGMIDFLLVFVHCFECITYDLYSFIEHWFFSQFVSIDNIIHTLQKSYYQIHNFTVGQLCMANK